MAMIYTPRDISLFVVSSSYFSRLY